MRKVQFILLLALVGPFLNQSSAQWVKLFPPDTIAGITSDPAFIIENDSGLLLLNQVTDTLAGDFWSYAEYNMLRPDGSIITKKTDIDSSFSNTYLNGFTILNENSIMAVERSDSVDFNPSTNWISYNIVKIDINSATVLYRKKITTNWLDSIWINNIHAHFDQDKLILACQHDSMGKSYPHVMCIDTLGNIMWSKTYNVFPTAWASDARAAITLKNGRIVVYGLGSTNKFDCTTSRGLYFMIDQNGNLVRTWQTGAGYHPCYGANPAIDTLSSGVLITSTGLWSGGLDYASRIDVVDTIGNLIDFYQNDDTLCPIQHWFDLNVIVDKVTSDIFLTRRMLNLLTCNPNRYFISLFRINHDLDTIRYEYKYRSINPIGLEAYIRSHDHSFYLAGFVQIPGHYNNCSFIIKLDSSGCLPPYCGGITLDFDSILTSLPEVQGAAPELTIYPNPAGETVRFRLANVLSRETSMLEVCALISGEVVATLPIAEGTDRELSCATWPSGAYVVRLLKNGEVLGYQKLMIVH